MSRAPIDLLVDAAKSHGDRTAVVDATERLTYAQLLERSAVLSSLLRPLLAGTGKTVALLLPNCVGFPIAFFAAGGAGAVVLPLNRQFGEEELRFYLADAEVRVILTDEDGAAAGHRLAESVATRPTVLVVRADAEATPRRGDDGWQGSDPQVDVLFQYSSGSTGRSKRVVRTAAALWAEADGFNRSTGLTPEDTIVCPAPLFHAHGLGNGLLAATRAGAQLVLLEGFQRKRFLDVVESERATVFPGVPLMFKVLAESAAAGRADLSSLRLCFSAGAPLPQSTFDGFLARTGLFARQLYGCTEAGSVTLNLDDDPRPTARSVGTALAGVGVSVLDDTGRPCGPREQGDVAIDSAALFRGYLAGDELDRSAFREGSFVTGDVGELDEDGRLTLIGRRTKFISTAGHKVDPAEVEGAIGALPSVAEVVVIGVPGSGGSEVVKAVVVASGSCSREDVVAACRATLAQFKVPRIVEFRDELPRNPLGKVLRKYLLE